MILQVKELAKQPYSMLFLLREEDGRAVLTQRKLYKPLEYAPTNVGHSRHIKRGMRVMLRSEHIAEQPSGYVAPNRVVNVYGYILESEGVFCTPCGYVCEDKFYEEYSWRRHKGPILLL